MGKIIACFPLILREQQGKLHVQQLYCCMCIRCRGNVFTEPLPSNVREDTQTHTKMIS
jgi:hypothetical protein